jgi:hypothetical protein
MGGGVAGDRRSRAARWAPKSMTMQALAIISPPPLPATEVLPVAFLRPGLNDESSG